MRTIILELEDIDYDVIRKAIAKRQSFRVWPDTEGEADGTSNIAGLALAEICRGWLAHLNPNVPEV